jgi:hypothetical protein
MEGCVDLLRVGLTVRLETADGALAIEGQIGQEVQRDSEMLALYGLLDLSAARGTLEISPPATEEPLAGYVRVFLNIWPEEVRVNLLLSAFELRDIGSDSPHYSYDPLDGRAPVDACDIATKPLAFDESIANTQGNSLAAVYPKIRDLLGDMQPFAASWSSGGTTSVSVELGQPFELCDLQGGRLGYKLPFAVESNDGRVKLQRDAKGYLAFENGQWREGWLEVFPAYDDGPASSGVEDPASFAQKTGISGVDFGDVGGGFWHTELYFGHTEPPVRGEVTVEGVDTDGHITGTKGVVLPEPIESLHW